MDGDRATLTAISALMFGRLATACGGKQVDDVDAAIDGASDAPFIDLNAHWGECCDTVDGSVGGFSPAADGGCPKGITRCQDLRYCGISESGGPPSGPPYVLICCGSRFTGPLPQSLEVDSFCPPFPAGASADIADAGAELGPHWGECCYADHGGTSKPCPPTDSAGYCPGDAGCAQCAVGEYCGSLPSVPPRKGCCGDRFVATIGLSPIDPTCPPAAWDGGS